MKDLYLDLEYCCEFPRMQLIHEVSMGYPPAVYCFKCNRMQGPSWLMEEEE